MKRLLVLDIVICAAFSGQLLFSPSSFLASAFEGDASSAVSRDLVRLLAGIYVSWTLALIWLRLNGPFTRSLSLGLLVGSLAQLPLVFTLEAVSSTFRAVNVQMLLLWCLAYGFVFLRWQ